MFGYSLGLSSGRTTWEVETELLGILGVRDLSEVPERWPAMTVSVEDREGMYQPGQEMYAEELGTEVTTEICYSIDNKTDWDEAARADVAMCVSAARLVDSIDATAVFFFQSDRVIMRRVGDVLYLSGEWELLWRNPDVLSRLPGTPVFSGDLDSMAPPQGWPI